MKAAFNPLVFTYGPIHKACHILYWLCDWNSNNCQSLNVSSSVQTEANPSSRDATAMLAIVFGGISSGFNSLNLPFVSDGGTRQDGQVEERIITGPISSPSHSRTSRPNKKDCPPALLLWNEKWAADQCSDSPFGVFTCHLSPPGQEWTLCSWRHRAPADDIGLWVPALCCGWMRCTVSVGCNLATCWLSDTERNTVYFRCNTFESKPN